MDKTETYINKYIYFDGNECITIESVNVNIKDEIIKSTDKEIIHYCCLWQMSPDDEYDEMYSVQMYDRIAELYGDLAYFDGYNGDSLPLAHSSRAKVR